jgi:L-2-hydroxycarboxylate dehydrogenase (NAD+)
MHPARCARCPGFRPKPLAAGNVKAVIKDILGHGNENCTLPGEPEAKAAALSEKFGGLLFTKAEVDAFAEIAKEAHARFEISDLKPIEV